MVGLSFDFDMKIAILVRGHIDIVFEEIVAKKVRLSHVPARCCGIPVLDGIVLTRRHLEGLNTDGNCCGVVGSDKEIRGVRLNWAINISRIGLRAHSPGI